MRKKVPAAAADVSDGGIQPMDCPDYSAGAAVQSAASIPGPVSRPVCHSEAETKGLSLSAALIAFLAAISVSLCVGCANPGPPRPPSLHLPALVTDLSAQRIGDRVLLRWTTPSRTTDDLAVKGTMMAQICREIGPGLGTPTARLSACAPVLRLAVVPGSSEVSDTLPAALRTDPLLLLTYRIRILNSSERSVGDSTNAAFSVAGTAPPPVDSLNVTASDKGAVLEWDSASKCAGSKVEFTRADNSTLAANAKPTKPAKARFPARNPPSGAENIPAAKPEPIRLRATETPDQASAGSTDTTAKPGTTYTYVADRVRPVSVGPYRLDIRSEPSAAVTVAMHDTFPPRIPAGLASIPSSGAATPYIDLSWEPNTEPDLAGYLVYRQLARSNGDPQGPVARLTPTPVTAPAYRDVAVSPGQRYIYWVTAVDASGNESAPSAKAQEAVTPE